MTIKASIGSGIDLPTLSEARWELAEKASRVLFGGTDVGSGAGRQLVRLTVPLEDTDPLSWLREQRLYPRTHWLGRDGLEVAAVGVADLQEGNPPEGPAALQKRLELLDGLKDPDVRYYGGLRFDPYAEPDEIWRPFGAYRFVLPRFELHRNGDASELVCNLVLPRDAGWSAEILARIEDLATPQEASGGDSWLLPRPMSRTDSPGWSGWKANVEQSLKNFSDGLLDKVVLARRVDFNFDGDLDAIRLMEGLRDATPGCFRFYVEPEEGASFVGASPERLFRREGRAVLSEAVAGSRPRGTSEADDEELREELLSSEKDLSEHTYVRLSIRETLGALCEKLEADEKLSEMKLAQGRHLVSKVRGTLREGVTDAEILEALHPTPAVGGQPKGVALGEIRTMEPFDRGWYAGPVGWIGSGGAEFAVGIRSGLVRGSTLQLFSGAGIVAGSEPEREWAEIEQKIGDFTRMFGIDPGNRQG
ncbi:MAG: isochorismate synthase [Rubrobacteraceae bacterium]